jgi:hypothetical protein
VRVDPTRWLVFHHCIAFQTQMMAVIQTCLRLRATSISVES